MGYRICFWTGYVLTMMVGLILFPFIYTNAAIRMNQRRRRRP